MGDSKYKEKIRHLSIINAVFVENKIMLMMKIILKKKKLTKIHSQKSMYRT